MSSVHLPMKEPTRDDLPQEIKAIFGVNDLYAKTEAELMDSRPDIYCQRIADSIAERGIEKGVCLVDVPTLKALPSAAEKVKRCKFKIPMHVVLSTPDGTMVQIKFDKSPQSTQG